MGELGGGCVMEEHRDFVADGGDKGNACAHHDLACAEDSHWQLSNAVHDVRVR